LQVLKEVNHLPELATIRD